MAMRETKVRKEAHGLEGLKISENAEKAQEHAQNHHPSSEEKRRTEE